MDDECTVTFDGDQGGTYYVPCNVVGYISDDGLYNTSNSSISLYTGIQSGNSTAYITIPAFSYPRYTVNNQYRYITNARNISFNNKANFIRNFDMVETYLLSLLALVSFINLIVRRGNR